MKYILIWWIGMHGKALATGSAEFNTYDACVDAGVELVSKPRAGIASNWICKPKG